MYGVSVAVRPLKGNEADERHNPHFPAYDGLRIASDKDLGKLFL